MNISIPSTREPVRPATPTIGQNRGSEELVESWARLAGELPSSETEYLPRPSVGRDDKTDKAEGGSAETDQQMTMQMVLTVVPIPSEARREPAGAHGDAAAHDHAGTSGPQSGPCHALSRPAVPGQNWFTQFLAVSMSAHEADQAARRAAPAATDAVLTSALVATPEPGRAPEPVMPSIRANPSKRAEPAVGWSHPMVNEAVPAKAWPAPQLPSPAADLPSARFAAAHMVMVQRNDKEPDIAVANEAPGTRSAPHRSEDRGADRTLMPAGGVRPLTVEQPGMLQQQSPPSSGDRLVVPEDHQAATMAAATGQAAPIIGPAPELKGHIRPQLQPTSPAEQIIQRLHHEMANEPGQTSRVLTVSLRPEHLGEVDIIIRVSAGRMRIRIEAATASAAMVLERDRGEIERLMLGTGTMISSADLTIVSKPSASAASGIAHPEWDQAAMRHDAPPQQGGQHHPQHREHAFAQGRNATTSHRDADANQPARTPQGPAALSLRPGRHV